MFKRRPAARQVQSARKLIDTEDLIDAISQTPCLWDPSNPDYKHKRARIKAWMNITKQVVQDYDNLSKSFKLEALKAVQSRWKAARDAYTRSKMQEYASADKKYVYFDRLTFLECCKRSDSGAKVQSQFSETSPLNPEETENVLTSVIKIKQCLSEQEEEMDTTENYEDNNYSEDHESRRKRPRNIIHKRKTRVSYDEAPNHYSQPTEQNDDLDFFKSLLPIVNKFTDNQKLMFRSDVLKIAMNVCNLSNSNNNTRRRNNPRREANYMTESFYSDED